MGFESYRVQLDGGRVMFQETNDLIRRLPNVKPDRGLMKTGMYYLMDDGRHKIELELMDNPVRISCRFTLCHPPSVDLAFLNLMRELMERLGMNVSIRDDVEPEHEHPFSLGEFAEFSVVILRSIAARRAGWILFGGTETLGATTNEAFERFILPRCQPFAGWEQLMQRATAVTSAKPSSTQLT